MSDGYVSMALSGCLVRSATTTAEKQPAASGSRSHNETWYSRIRVLRSWAIPLMTAAATRALPVEVTSVNRNGCVSLSSAFTLPRLISYRYPGGHGPRIVVLWLLGVAPPAKDRPIVSPARVLEVLFPAPRRWGRHPPREGCGWSSFPSTRDRRWHPAASDADRGDKSEDSRSSYR